MYLYEKTNNNTYRDEMNQTFRPLCRFYCEIAVALSEARLLILLESESDTGRDDLLILLFNNKDFEVVEVDRRVKSEEDFSDLYAFFENRTKCITLTIKLYL